MKIEYYFYILDKSIKRKTSIKSKDQKTFHKKIIDDEKIDKVATNWKRFNEINEIDIYVFPIYSQLIGNEESSARIYELLKNAIEANKSLKNAIEANKSLILIFKNNYQLNSKLSKMISEYKYYVKVNLNLGKNIKIGVLDGIKRLKQLLNELN